MTQQSLNKARELVEKYWQTISGVPSYADYIVLAKQCAIILCDEMIKEVSDNISHIGRGGLSDMKFWEQVKQAINQL